MADHRHAAATELLAALNELQQAVDTFGWRGEPAGYPTEDDYNALPPLQGRVVGLAAGLGLPAPPPLELAGLVVNCRSPLLPGVFQGMYRPGGGRGDDCEESRGRWRRGLNVLRAAAEAIAGTPTDPPTDVAGSFHLSGGSWAVCYGEEKGAFDASHYGPIATLVKLLDRPHHAFELLDLVDADARAILERPESQDITLDNPAIADLKRRHEEVCRDTEGEDDPLVKQELEQERAMILAELQRAVGPDRRRRNLGRTAADTAWDTLTKGLRRLPGRLGQKKMPELAAHLDRHIHFDQPTIAYRPPENTPPWDVRL
jgi:hypothetical protein